MVGCSKCAVSFIETGVTARPRDKLLARIQAFIDG
jgi:hypothetical protein